VAAAIRPLAHADRERVREIIVATDTFTASEVATAMELIDEWLAASEASDYLTYVLDDPDNGGVRGYVCFGPTPLTDSTYDLYWIAVDPAVQGRGYGRQLTQFAEGEVRRRGGRTLLIETSSLDKYAPTVHFYESSNYSLVARIPNFYREGDDKLIYAKDLAK